MGTKLTLQIEDKIASVEVPHWDCTASDIMEMLVGVMVSHTWLQESIYSAMKEYAEGHSNED